ncbi:MAG: hypothetical protein VX546_03950 [Myxococcota bacterium]|nr:hypothetical protein [Myxococcota bacterium]
METLREGRARYFRKNGLPEDGGYDARWVVIRARGFPVAAFPNSDARRRAVGFHDLHHVLTGYDTTLLGEAEIAAWELSSGCGNFWAAWALNAAALGIWWVLGPRRCRAAWRRGRASRNLYRVGAWDGMLAEAVDKVRAQLGIPENGELA